MEEIHNKCKTTIFLKRLKKNVENVLPRAHKRPIRPDAEKQDFAVLWTVEEDLTLLVNK